MSLIEDAKNKNPDAFEQLIQPQLQRMYRVAISMLSIMSMFRILYEMKTQVM